MNTELLEAVLAQIRYEPERHDQNHWIVRTSTGSCDTAKCAAGWSLILSGQYEEVVPENYVRDPYFKVRDPYFQHANSGRRLEHQRTPVPDVARDLLGLTNEQAACLFYECSTRDDVEYIGKLLLNGWEKEAADEYFAEKDKDPYDDL